MEDVKRVVGHQYQLSSAMVEPGWKVSHQNVGLESDQVAVVAPAKLVLVIVKPRFVGCAVAEGKVANVGEI